MPLKATCDYAVIKGTNIATSNPHERNIRKWSRSVIFFRSRFSDFGKRTVPVHLDNFTIASSSHLSPTASFRIHMIHQDSSGDQSSGAASANVQEITPPFVVGSISGFVA